MLKLFFGGDPKRLAPIQRVGHARRLEGYRARAASDDGTGPGGPRRALEAGIRHEQERVRFWTELG